MLRLKLIICFSLVLITQLIYSQKIKGKVIDENSKQPVPFALIGIEGSNKGTTSDIDGNFEIKKDSSVINITIQIIGYQRKVIDVRNYDLRNPLLVKLTPSDIRLQEIVIVPKENPANELIRQLIKNKKKLDPRNLPYYSCETYGKTYFTLSSKEGNEFYYNDDTAKFRKDKKFLDRNYLFFIESSSEKKYIYKNKSQEKIIASRVSGFKSAPFASLASQLQSFTFFDDNIDVLDIKYVNPLLKGTFNRYNFEIRDTLIEENDTTILIAFYPKKNSNFKALKGTIYLNKNMYALANVIAEPATYTKDNNSVKIQQKYSLIQNKYWFPTQLVTEILFNNVSSSSSTDNEKQIMKCVSKLYISKVNFDSSVYFKNKNIEVINAKDFDRKDEDFWRNKRMDSLNSKEKNTYQLIDSVGKAENFELKLKTIKILSTGQIPVGFLSLDITKFFKVNDYENFRLGAGLVTNDKLSKWAEIGAFAGYGFKDQAWKYGGHFRLNFNGAKSIFLKAEMAKDLTETAGTSFIMENTSLISTQNIRSYLVGVMDKNSYAKLSFNAPINNFIRSSIYWSTSQRISPSSFGNYYNMYQDHFNTFNTNEIGVQFKIWPFEKFSESFVGLISLGSKAPCFYINYSQTLPVNIYGYSSNFLYNKLDLKIEQKINFKIKGYFNYQLQAGKVFGNVPYSFQYNNKGSRTDKYSVSADNTFETMFLNEFISTEYTSLFLTYNTGKIIRHNKYFNPEFELIHNAGIGKLNNREQLMNIELNDISRGFTETGIRIKGIVKSGISTLGIGAFYRYGNYSYSKQSNNFVLKLVVGFDLN